MRPARRILLYAKDDDETGIFRFLLRNSRPSCGYPSYLVSDASTLQSLAALLREEFFDLVVCLLPLDDAPEGIRTAKKISPKTPVLLVSPDVLDYKYSDADGWVCGKKYPVADLLERVRIMIQRKRGPKSGYSKEVEGKCSEEKREAA